MTDVKLGLTSHSLIVTVVDLVALKFATVNALNLLNSQISHLSKKISTIHKIFKFEFRPKQLAIEQSNSEGILNEEGRNVKIHGLISRAISHLTKLT